jgi:hypothetical protein
VKNYFSISVEKNKAKTVIEESKRKRNIKYVKILKLNS